MSPRKPTGTAEITPEGRAALMEAMEEDAKAVAGEPVVAASEPPAAAKGVCGCGEPQDGSAASVCKKCGVATIRLDRHALDACPIGSKLVATEQGTVLATPEWEKMLPKDDPASKLPTGARIQKIGEGAYRSIQLDSGREQPALVTATAYEAVTQFVQHFHG